ncbi:MAG: cytochrome c biogenesis protein CcsA [Bacteroidaceae bacterium]
MSLSAIVICLISATIVDKLDGTTASPSQVYGSPWLYALWVVLALVGIAIMVKCRLWHRPAVLLLHIAFLIIMVGGLITHAISFSGTVVLNVGETSNILIREDNTTELLPFYIKLDTFLVNYHADTDTPADYESRLTIVDTEGRGEKSVSVSVNKVFDYEGFRFFQTACDTESRQSVLTLSHDLLGTAVTFFGYALLFVSMILFFFGRKSRYRCLLAEVTRMKYLGVAVALLLPCCLSASSLKSASPEVAEEFGRLSVMYRGRVCPINTLSRDFCKRLYGSTSYSGFNSDRVLCGWLFYPGEWASDYKKRFGLEADLSLPASLYKGELLKIFPIKSEHGNVSWLGHSDGLPESLEVGEWMFVRKVLSLLQQMVMTHNDSEALEVIKKMGVYQKKRAPQAVVEGTRLNVELVYNKMPSSKVLAVILLVAGFLFMFLSANAFVRGRALNKVVKTVGISVLLAMTLLLFLMFAMRWIALGSLPLTSGYEAMVFMSVVVLVLSLFIVFRLPVFVSVSMIVAGFSLLVSGIGGEGGGMSAVMPVLSSPLLSVHVVTIMLSYALLAVIFVLSLAAVSMRVFAFVSDFRFMSPESLIEAEKRFSILNRLVLTPALFLLATGIFVGAIWANQSWGSYWQWDPKETWALITMLIYSVPVHGFFKIDKTPLRLHFYLMVAFLSVAFTYFGVNFFLGGIHSYGGVS